MVDFPPPHQVSDEIHNISITGALIPWMDGQPAYVKVGGPDIFVPVFPSEEALQEIMTVFGIEFHSIKRIDDPGDFLSSFPQFAAKGVRIRFLFDPKRTPQGTIGFKEILRYDS